MSWTGRAAICTSRGGRLRLDTVGIDAGRIEVKLLHEAKDAIVLEAEERAFSQHQELGGTARGRHNLDIYGMLTQVHHPISLKINREMGLLLN
jgi:hypothetical protein